MMSILSYPIFLNLICFSYAGLNYSTIRFLYYESSTNVHDVTDITPVKYFNGNSEIIVIVPGWMESTDLPWVNDFVEGYLYRNQLEGNSGKYHVIGVEWGYEANGWYYHVTGIVDLVGDFIGEWLIKRATADGFNVGRYHIVSNSIGCQVAGFIGKKVVRELGYPVSRITALDAAGPGFFFKGPKEKLYKGDAEVVVAIHTDIGWKGLIEPFGDLDFYPNGGLHPQPGCLDMVINYVLEPCSHRRARLTWVEALYTQNFHGTKCDSWKHFVEGLCAHNKRVNFAGYMNSVTKADSGLYYAYTNSKPPLIID